MTHDGKLVGGRRLYYAALIRIVGPDRAYVEIHDTSYDDYVSLEPKQALSLLVWLEQERETLVRLAEGRLLPEEELQP